LTLMTLRIEIIEKYFNHKRRTKSGTELHTKISDKPGKM
jgi:hypothetical protein